MNPPLLSAAQQPGAAIPVAVTRDHPSGPFYTIQRHDGRSGLLRDGIISA